MMIAQHAEPALMNVRLKQFLKGIFIRLIRMNAPIAEHVLMYVRLKPYILFNGTSLTKAGFSRLFFIQSLAISDCKPWCSSEF